ncbi:MULTISPECIES: flagellar filament capping protein FliD [unclassified Chromobacterium]|uniref:flagellar filament capping protein FliD n=1 Tax=unclassified Chromobacterium TaxID=2641838 RepID=UPI000D325CDF|nr:MULTISPECIES: flagellar filament capping protein FliD [unclassified Chromobacterium]PTU65076.1 flagellar protein [Chromobacterium sp. Panama]UJB30856.1 flagellar filament capping protein FliD [Chromobacterium sp. Beijing]
MASITTSVGPLDVQSIVSQLIAVDSQPLTQSQSRVSNYQSQLSSIGQISSALSSLQTASTAMASGSFLQQFQIASTDNTIASASATSGGVAGNYALNVTQLAQPRQLVFDQTSGGQAITDQNAALAGAPGALSFTVNGTTSTVQLGQNGSAVSLSSIADSINSAGIGVNASVVEYNSKFSLVLASAQSGPANAFSIAAGGSDSGAASGNTLAGLSQSSAAAGESAAAQDALLTVNGVNVSSSSNTLSNVINGATVNLNKLGQVTLNMSQNTANVTSTLQTFVSAYNQVISASNAALNGSMKNNSDVIGLQEQLSGLLSTPVPGVNASSSYAYLAQVGITQQADGTLKLDSSAFTTALNADPGAVANLFGNAQNNGYANAFNTAINNLLGPNGMITADQGDINVKINDETNLQAQLNNQLANEKSSLLNEYTALNSELSAMQQSTSSLANLLA